MAKTQSILLICDCYNLSNSGGRLISDLEFEILERGFSVKILHQTEGTIRTGVFGSSTKKITGNLKRGIDEILLSLALCLKVLVMPNSNFIGVISYSPSIFLFLPALVAKLKFRIKYYQITRDIFPQWLLQAGVIQDGVAYKILKWCSKLSYSSASYIGLQSRTDKDIVDKISGRPRVSEILDNWRIMEPFERQEQNHDATTGIRIMYAGNVGEAQQLELVFSCLLDLNLYHKVEIDVYGFGRALGKLEKHLSEHRYFEMINFREPVSEKELFKSSNDCHFGLVALGQGLLTGNIPGKTLTYLNCGLPIIGVARKASELEDLIKSQGIGIFFTHQYLSSICGTEVLKNLLETSQTVEKVNLTNCLKNRFSTNVALEKILSKFRCSEE